MSDNSARLNLPYIAPNQAQKHVTHNEALQVLDAVTQLSVVEVGAATPPDTPDIGAVYALGSAPTGVWAAQPGQLAYRTESGWLYLAPQEGWRAWDQQSGQMHVFSGTDWAPLESSTQNTDGLGIQTSWDQTNRFAMASDAALFSHAGSGHQIKINKSAAGETAALLFQSDWTGHAEFGLAGENAFSIKISADGAAWQTAMRFDPAAGEIDAQLPITGTAVQSGPTDVTPGRLMRADYGFGPGNVVGTVSEAAGVPTGAVVESGSTSDGDYTRWADGTQICWVAIDTVFDQTRRLVADWTFPKPFAVGSKPVTTASLETENNVAPVGEEILPPMARKGLTLRNETCNIRVYRIAGGTDFDPADTLRVFAMAIGRWF